MYLYEPCYDIDELFRRNFHLHTYPQSRCAKPEMLYSDLVRAAENAGLREIAITNHIQPGEEEQCVLWTSELRKKIAETDTVLKIYAGAELSAYGIDKYSFHDGDAPLDFRMYAHNHYHLDVWEQPEDRSPAGYKKHCSEVIRSVIASGRADCMAHPFTDGYIVRGMDDSRGFTRGCITELWTENELGDILSFGKEHGTAWEINTKNLPAYPDFAKMYFNLGREIGVCFTVGSDAHRLCDIDILPQRSEFKKLFGL